MSRQDRERELERALAGTLTDAPDPETERLTSLARMLGRLRASSPEIDQRRVWRRVQAGMLAQPQRTSRWPRFTLPRPAMFLAAVPRPLLAGSVAIALLLGAALTAVLLQPQESASAAFLDEIEGMAQASGAAADRGTVSAEESVALEQRALGLLELASAPQVLGRLRPTEAELAHQRLMEARSALAAVVGDNPGDARALAALAAISGLLDGPASVDATRGAPPAEIEEPPAASPSVDDLATPAIEGTSAPTAVATTRQGRSDDSSRTPEANDSRGPGSAPAAAPATAGAAVSAAQIGCARVYDASSLSICANAASTALAACAQAHGADGCQKAIETALSTAQQRVQRVGEDCQRLPSSRAREACSEATNKGSSGSGSSGNSGSGGRGGEDSNSGRSGGGRRNESDSRDRRD